MAINGSTSYAPALTAAKATGAACVRRSAHRFQDRLVHLLRIEPKPGGVRLHDGDPANQCFAPLTLFLNLLRQLADLAFEVILLDCGVGDERSLPLSLLCLVDLAIQSVLVQRGRTDPEDGSHASHVERSVLRRVCFGDCQMFSKSLTQIPPTLIRLVDTMASALLFLVFVYPFRHWAAGLACFGLLALVLFLANLVMRDTDNPFNGIWNVSSKPF